MLFTLLYKLNTLFPLLQLIETVDVATSEVGLLHGKVDRLKKVQAHNEVTLTNMDNKLTTNIQGLDSIVQQHSTQQAERHEQSLIHIGK